MKKAIGYIRVSSDQQVQDGESLTRQREQVEAYAKMKGLNLVQVVSDEGISGFRDDRPGYQSILRAVFDGTCDVVIVPELSRLSRKTRTILYFIEEVVEKNKVEFVSLRETIDTTTPVGKLMVSMIANLNQFYRDEISYKSKLAKRHKKSKGEFCGGLVPYGYSRIGNSLVENPEEQLTLRAVFDMREMGFPLAQIAKCLEQRGAKTRTGNSKWSTSTILKLLNQSIDTKEAL